MMPLKRKVKLPVGNSGNLDMPSTDPSFNSDLLYICSIYVQNQTPAQISSHQVADLDWCSAPWDGTVAAGKNVTTPYKLPRQMS